MHIFRWLSNISRISIKRAVFIRDPQSCRLMVEDLAQTHFLVVLTRARTVARLPHPASGSLKTAPPCIDQL